MLSMVSGQSPVDSGVVQESERYLQAFRWMLLARLLDDKFASLYRGGKIHGGVFLGRGQEALSSAADPPQALVYPLATAAGAPRALVRSRGCTRVP